MRACVRTYVRACVHVGEVRVAFLWPNFPLAVALCGVLLRFVARNNFCMIIILRSKTRRAARPRRCIYNDKTPKLSQIVAVDEIVANCCSSVDRYSE